MSGYKNVLVAALFLGEEETALDMFAYLMETGVITEGTSSVTDTSNTPRWPEIKFRGCPR